MRISDWSSDVCSSDLAVSSEAMVCVVAKADRPPRLERIDLATGERQVLFDPNAALAADMGKTTPSRLLRWTDAKGQEFTGQFFPRSEEHTSELQSLMRISYAVFCLKKKNKRPPEQAY